MIYPKNSADKLGFSQILVWTAENCSSTLGKKLIPTIKFEIEPKKILHQLRLVDELKQILEKGLLNLQLNIDIDLKEKLASKEGFYYTEEDLASFVSFFRNTEDALDFFTKFSLEFPLLCKIFRNIKIPISLTQLVLKILDVDGQIKSNASKALLLISQKIELEKKRLTSRSQAIFENSKKLGYTADTELTIKDGRVVIPVLSEHKRKIPGILVDQSGSGRISYIEPSELVEINNVLAELLIDRRQEIIKILKEVTKQIVPYLKMLVMVQKKLAQFDLIRAKAIVAITFGGIIPEVNNEEVLLFAAINPLLQHRLEEEKSKNIAVPLHIELNPNQRLIVISGPNAGGKSVAMKTLGLLQLMLQNGYLIPCNVGSKMKIFENIFSDIGDNQSIESDLSTYSSHLKSAKHILNFSDQNTLVLMDEIGTGTDPQLGGALAEAVLEEIHNKGAYGIVTTHFGNIKIRADKLKNAVNAAMLFDLEHLMPLYQLAIGQAGSSFTFEVAQKIGLNKKVIKKARSYAQTKQFDYDKLLAEVQHKGEVLEKELNKTKELQEQAAYWQQEYKTLKETLNGIKKELLEQAKSEANQIILEANAKIERTIREIKEHQADKEKTMRIRKELSKEVEKANSEKTKQIIEKKPTHSFKLGDRVQLQGSNSIGEIIKIQEQKIEIDMGGIITRTKVENIQKVGSEIRNNVTKYVSHKKFDQLSQVFNSELDVRGLRTLEAIEVLDKWMDDALMLGFRQVKIIHGIGNGILRNQLRTHLRKNSLIAQMSDAEKMDGGQGSTIITFK
jgi:DNA mismatch repair protein MutS2